MQARGGPLATHARGGKRATSESEEENPPHLVCETKGNPSSTAAPVPTRFGPHWRRSSLPRRLPDRPGLTGGATGTASCSSTYCAVWTFARIISGMTRGSPVPARTSTTCAPAESVTVRGVTPRAAPSTSTCAASGREVTTSSPSPAAGPGAGRDQVPPDHAGLEQQHAENDRGPSRPQAQHAGRSRMRPRRFRGSGVGQGIIVPARSAASPGPLSGTPTALPLPLSARRPAAVPCPHESRPTPRAHRCR